MHYTRSIELVTESILSVTIFFSFSSAGLMTANIVLIIKDKLLVQVKGMEDVRAVLENTARKRCQPKICKVRSWGGEYIFEEMLFLVKFEFKQIYK